MNTSQLLCIIQSDPILSTSIKGVFAADQVPKYIRKGGFIANTDDSNHTGKHWCAFFFDGLGRSEFYDSYGNGPEYYSKHFSLCLRTNSSAQRHNTIKLQNNYSNVCGQYSLFYLIHRIRGQSMKDITETLINTRHADQFVYDYIATTFPYCICNDGLSYHYNQYCSSINKSY